VTVVGVGVCDGVGDGGGVRFTTTLLATGLGFLVILDLAIAIALTLINKTSAAKVIIN
jgi:hypothetical protein